MKSYFENGVTVVDTGRKNNDRISATGHKGIYKHPDGGYQARYNKLYLGSYPTLEEAVAVRQEAERQSKAGTIDEWAKQFRRDNVNERNPDLTRTGKKKR